MLRLLSSALALLLVTHHRTLDAEAWHNRTQSLELPVKKEPRKLPDFCTVVHRHLSILVISAHIEALRLHAEHKPRIDALLRSAPAAVEPRPAQELDQLR